LFALSQLEVVFYTVPSKLPRVQIEPLILVSCNPHGDVATPIATRDLSFAPEEEPKNCGTSHRR
jgi:hypothetical protein